MSHGVLGMVLAAALLHALWNLGAKRASGDSYLFVWCYAVLSAVLWLPLGLALAFHDGWSWGLVLAPVLSGALHVVYGLILQRGYAAADLGLVYPVARGTGPLLTMLVAIGLLGERPDALALVGCAVVLLGIVVVAGGGLFRVGRASVASGIGYGLATGVAIAGYTLWDDHAVTGLGLTPVTYFALSVGWQSLLMTPGVPARRPRLRPLLAGSWREIVLIAVASPAAYVLVLVAMQTTPVALVAPVRESSIVIGSLLAWWLFKEKDPARRLTGAVIVLGGIGLIAFG